MLTGANPHRWPHRWLLIRGLALLLAWPPFAIAQDARLLEPPTPVAELPYEFTHVTGTHELRDGRVLVVDGGDATLHIADLNRGDAVRLGRHGSGPGEYRRPMFLYPLAGDSVGVLDDAAARILVVTRDGRPGGFLPVRASHSIGGRGLAPAARFSDSLGWFYGQRSAVVLGPDGALQPSDSAPLARWRGPEGAPELIGFVHMLRIPGRRVMGGMAVVAPGTPQPAPRTRPLWTVAVDGRVAVIVPDPFHVRLRARSGTWVTGSPIPYMRVPVNDSVKAAYLADRTPTPTVHIRGRSGEVSVERRTRARATPPVWASEVPPFRSDAFIAFAPNGPLWIQRTTFGSEGARYDLIGERGELLDRVRLPDGHRVVGFGRSSMFVVRRDADDLEYLQRWPIPSSQ